MLYESANHLEQWWKRRLTILFVIEVKRYHVFVKAYYFSFISTPANSCYFPAQHEKTSSKRQPGQTNRFLDPWITERVLHNQLRKMVMIENKFQEDMIRFQRDAAHFDAGIVLKLQAVFAEFSNIQSNQWHMMQVRTSINDKI